MRSQSSSRRDPGREDFRQRVTFVHPAEPRGDPQQVEVVIAEHDARAGAQATDERNTCSEPGPRLTSRRRTEPVGGGSKPIRSSIRGVEVEQPWTSPTA